MCSAVLRSPHLPSEPLLALPSANQLRFRFDIDRRAWWQWLGYRWIEVVDDHAITDILTEDRLLLAHEFERDGRSDLSTKLENSREWATQINGSRSEWWARMRTNLARPTPAPPEWQLATPDGVVDLRTGKVEPHDPFEHDTLAVTKGHYRTGAGDESYLFDVLENRLESNMAREDLESLLELLGLGITGEAPVKRPCILWVSGPSGSGKGMVGNLVLEAFGSVAHAVKAETLQRRSNDIDSEIASVLEANPRLIVCDEMGGKVSEKKWMGLTGNTPLDRAETPRQREKASGAGTLVRHDYFNAGSLTRLGLAASGRTQGGAGRGLGHVDQPGGGAPVRRHSGGLVHVRRPAGRGSQALAAWPCCWRGSRPQG